MSDLRASKDLTQEDSAKKLGVTRQAYQHYEAGRNDPNLDQWGVICEMLGITIEMAFAFEKARKKGA